MTIKTFAGCAWDTAVEKDVNDFIKDKIITDIKVNYFLQPIDGNLSSKVMVSYTVIYKEHHSSSSESQENLSELKSSYNLYLLNKNGIRL